MKRIIRWFATGPDSPAIGDPDKIHALFQSRRLRVFVWLVLGYGFFYTCRLSLSVAKKPMLDEGVLSVEQMGIIGSMLLFVYAFGKFFNGFLADRANIRRFMSIALLCSAFANLLFGSVSNFALFAILWAFNGWFQSIGSAPSVVSICQWFSNRERGTRYGVWAGAHNIGEGLTF
ncbi:MAG: MFS transporter, partial [Gammaproteobacteria bacterium]|nr:MFS transporter [Gammaproteobacteria bacterium]